VRILPDQIYGEHGNDVVDQCSPIHQLREHEGFIDIVDTEVGKYCESSCDDAGEDAVFDH